MGIPQWVTNSADALSGDDKDESALLEGQAMYIPDLSPRHPHEIVKYTFLPRDTETLIPVGWLEKGYDYPQGDVSGEFLAKLWMACLLPCTQHMGYHPCPFCEDSEWPTMTEYREQKLPLGNGIVSCTSKEGVTYVAPNLIVHYVINHKYAPPQEFIEAIMTGQLIPAPPMLTIEQIRQMNAEAKAAEANRLRREHWRAFFRIEIPHIQQWIQKTWKGLWW